VAVTDFDTKAAIVVRDDLAVWQRLNVAAFLMSAITAAAGAEAVGEPYEDATGCRYLPMFRQPVLVFEASAGKLRTVHRRALDRDAPMAIYTSELFTTGHDRENRAAVKAIETDALDLVGIGLRAGHKTVDGILRGLRRHP
jgi:hypothetical protein